MNKNKHKTFVVFEATKKVQKSNHNDILFSCRMTLNFERTRNTYYRHKINTGY